MEKYKHTQLELFSQLSENRLNGSQTSSRKFCTFIWGYEKIIVFIIVFILTAIVSFSLGVEKGKRITAKNTNSHIELASAAKLPPAAESEEATQHAVIASAPQPQPQPQDASSLVKQQPAPESKQKIITTSNTKEEKGSYTIQVATYKDKTRAQQEAQQLKKKGFYVLTLSKSGYTILCIGSFNSKDKANAKLSEIKKKYSDSYVRRL